MSVSNLARSYRIAIVLAALAALMLLPATTAFGQGTGTVGVLVEFPGGDVRAFCVEIETPTTNVPPLLATGLDVETGFGGDAVCGIEGIGCPEEDCWCECPFTPGDPCFLWNYCRWNQADGVWDCPFDLTVEEGDVIAWVWGELDTATFAPIDTPSLDDVTLDEVCAMQFEQEFVPEPATVLLLGSGLAGLAGYAGLRVRASKNRSN